MEGSPREKEKGEGDSGLAAEALCANGDSLLDEEEVVGRCCCCV